MIDDLPHPVWSGTFTIFGIDVNCHTLSDGRKIIEEESMNQFQTLTMNPEAKITFDKEWQRFITWFHGVP